MQPLTSQPYSETIRPFPPTLPQESSSIKEEKPEVNHTIKEIWDASLCPCPLAPLSLFVGIITCSTGFFSTLDSVMLMAIPLLAFPFDCNAKRNSEWWETHHTYIFGSCQKKR